MRIDFSNLKFKKIITIISLFLLGLFSFSIPCFSNNYPYNYITIAIGIAFVLIACFKIFLIDKQVHCGYLLISYLAFAIAIIVSQIVNNSLGLFPKTMVLLLATSIVIYEFSKNIENKSHVFLSILFGGIAFSLVFIVYYSKSFLHFSFSQRLGAVFNDQNQLGRMICVYSIIAFSQILNAKKSIFKVFYIFCLILFVAIIFMTGSISNLITLTGVLSIVIFIILKDIKKRVVFLTSIFALVVLFFVFLQTPFMSYFKNRIYGIIGSLFGSNGSQDKSTNSRFLISLSAFKLFLLNPFYGNGYFSVSEYSLYGATGHNNFFQLLADFGLIGFVSFEFQFVFSIRRLSFYKKEEMVAKTLALYLLIFQLFLSTYHQKMDYLIMPVVISYVKKESMLVISLHSQGVHGLKNRTNYIINHGLSSNLLKMKIGVLISNIQGIVGKIRLRNKWNNVEKSEYRFLDLKEIMREGQTLSNEYYSLNSFYGHSNILKRFSNYKGKVCATIEHGLYFGDVFMTDEVQDNPLRSIITMSDYRKNKISMKCQYNTFSIGPYIAYASQVLSIDELKKTKKKIGKTLLVIPSHSIKHMKSIFDKDCFVDKIISIKKENRFKTVIICIYYQDILNDVSIVDYYKKKGFFVTTCGFRENRRFLDRQRTLFELCDVSMSNSVGTHIGYSIYLNKPHYIFNQDVIKETDNNGLNNEFLNNTALVDRADLGSKFEVYSESISEEQRSACDQYFGFNNVKNDGQLREIMEQCYINMRDSGAGLSSKGRLYEISI